LGRRVGQPIRNIAFGASAEREAKAKNAASHGEAAQDAITRALRDMVRETVRNGWSPP